MNVTTTSYPPKLNAPIRTATTPSQAIGVSPNRDGGAPTQDQVTLQYEQSETNWTSSPQRHQRFRETKDEEM
ncbi:hypothetical protein M513_11471 [Trichuris suis]|uniref:Uncharacterized protein n=1 Tax=Trichuris suis TaxID=68888 RepID=A0A085LRT4_9BILA|nr:hypothetical protein M513_11471 [Trichuris suis]